MKVRRKQKINRRQVLKRPNIFLEQHNNASTILSMPFVERRRSTAAALVCCVFHARHDIITHILLRHGAGSIFKAFPQRFQTKITLRSRTLSLSHSHSHTLTFSHGGLTRCAHTVGCRETARAESAERGPMPQPDRPISVDAERHAVCDAGEVEMQLRGSGRCVMLEELDM